MKDRRFFFVSLLFFFFSLPTKKQKENYSKSFSIP